jgi:hypothetical protein
MSEMTEQQDRETHMARRIESLIAERDRLAERVKELERDVAARGKK